MRTTLEHTMHRKAIIYNPNASLALQHIFYQWETLTIVRCILKMKWRGSEVSETEVVYEKITGCFQIFVDGTEVGPAKFN